MKVVIAGGTGLIGKELTLALQRSGREVLLLSRNPERYRSKFPASVQIARWDPTTSGWEDALRGSAAIVNLAGTSIGGKRWSPKRKAEILSSRTNSTVALTQGVLAQDRKPVKFIQASAIGYYGARGAEPLTESSTPGSDFLAEVCQAWERPLAKLETSGVESVVIRSGHILAGSGGALPLLALPFRFFVGGPLGSGSQWFSWIHIDDEVRAIIHLLENRTSHGVYNLTASEPVTNADFAAKLGKVLRRPAWFPLPGFLFRLLVGELAGSMLTGQRALPERLLSEGFQFNHPDLLSGLKEIYPQ